MKIDISDIRGDIGAFKEVHLTKEDVDVQLKGRDIEIENPVEMDLQVINTDESFLVTGTIDLYLAVKCSRCLKPFEMAVEAKVEEEVSKDRVEVGQLTTIDIEDEVIDSIMLAVPMKPVCDDECAGLCPSCGINLNFEDCDCFMHTVDPRLAKLEELLDND
ncbi:MULTISPECIES: YceD family protein [unclassified Candidatus Frackibacter]|uniref:YceD family protein n=1 Tax=unclassified Candidatus Frackibacter TaxID=2648818 RepID=UPI000883CB0B|nr:MULTISPECIES: DUF177 domain-containing protein [unclassified Candidatus Frackibacter]SDC51592.1 uncharacterized protein SAMN04515661_11256 [Candidatus Frackibacter sp. WG11]SEM41058.1 uncharacterized protein SAMN04488698_10355 [Candidatus Frackibacter sp. WG12]SFL75607.1 uncharacterized protein SAMN04488699_11253 [Candidatus Frackibacter sp. WG13]